MKFKSVRAFTLVFAVVAISYHSAPRNRRADMGTTYPESIKDESSPGRDIFTFWKLSGSQKYAIIAENDKIHKIRRLKEFQSVTHSILLKQELDFPRKIEEIESFMYKLNLQPEYWKTTLPSIFDPRG